MTDQARQERDPRPMGEGSGASSAEVIRYALEIRAGTPYRGEYDSALAALDGLLAELDQAKRALAEVVNTPHAGTGSNRRMRDIARAALAALSPEQTEPGADASSGRERAMRFGYLLSEIEIEARKMLDGRQPDLVLGLTVIHVHTSEAREIAAEVSREALDKVVDADQ